MPRIGRSRPRNSPGGRTPRPEKTCPACGRPFQWRARWRRQWEQVVYCSRRCAGRRQPVSQDP
ncbi:MAG: DUF2256 domain-containing protein [Halioglobus sp.]